MKYKTRAKKMGSSNKRSYPKYQPEYCYLCRRAVGRKCFGGIMENAELGNPCFSSSNSFQGISLDEETDEIKLFFEFMYENLGNKSITKQEIKEIIINSNENLFSYIDWNKKSDQIKFGNKIERFKGRLFSNIRMISDGNSRASRRKYQFILEKGEKSGNVVMSGNAVPMGHNSTIAELQREGKPLPIITTLPPSILDLLKENDEKLISLDEIKEFFPNPEEDLKELKEKGVICEPKSGLYQNLG